LALEIDDDNNNKSISIDIDWTSADIYFYRLSISTIYRTRMLLLSILFFQGNKFLKVFNTQGLGSRNVVLKLRVKPSSVTIRMKAVERLCVYFLRTVVVTFETVVKIAFMSILKKARERFLYLDAVYYAAKRCCNFEVCEMNRKM